MEDLKGKNFSKIKAFGWTIVSVTLGISLASIALSFFENNIDKISNEGGRALAVESIIKNEKPKYFYINQNSYVEPKVSAKAYLVGDLNTGEVILAKNQDQKLPIASVSKLMTAYVAKEIVKGDEEAKASQRALLTYGGNGGVRVGEKIIKKIKKEGKNLNIFSTFFEDPSGLSENNQSTPADLFKFTGFIKQATPELLQITTKRNYSTKKHSWPSTNQFLHDSGYMGGKSGYTDPALQTVVSLFSLPLSESSTRPMGIVLLRSWDRRKDVETILKYLKKNVYYGGEADASTDWVREKVGAPDIREPDYVTMTFGGDIMLDRGVKNSVIKNFNNDYSALFGELEMLKDSDIVFANLEGTASDVD